jgi:hypothetical protein
MNGEIYRFKFDERVPLMEVRYSVVLAALAAEGVHGRAQVLLDAGHFIEEKTRVCIVDATTPVGRTIAQIFTGLVTREFGEEAFTVEQVVQPAEDQAVRHV